MKSHVVAIGVMDVAAGILFTCLAAVVLVAVLVLAPWFYGAPVWGPEDATVVLSVVLFVSGVFLLIGIPNLIAGVGLLRQKPWARVPAIILAVLALTSFPVGTAVGLYALWVFGQKDTDQVFDTAA